ncbi:MAG: hypothetical protein AAFX06_09865 [Planctomycetota bacterium]
MNSASSPLCERFQASISRVVEIDNFSCEVADGKTIVRGSVENRHEAALCSTVARLVPGGANLVVKMSVAKSTGERHSA